MDRLEEMLLERRLQDEIQQIRNEKRNGILRKIPIVVALVIVALASFFSVVRIVDPTERAVIVRMGKVVDEVHSNGILFKYPLIESVEKFDLAPKKIELSFGVDEKGAVSKDMQTIGVSATIFFKYDENRILDIVKHYNTSAINDIFGSSLKASIKDEIGKYTIYEIIEHQDEITSNVEKNLSSRINEHPISVVELSLTNWDWPDQFDKQIEQTMKVAQEVKQEQQNTLKQEQQNKREISISEKEKEKAIIKADGELEAAKKRAEATRIEADAQAYKNKVLATNWAIEKQVKELEIERLKAERWNGAYVPNNNYMPVPFNYGTVQGK